MHPMHLVDHLLKKGKNKTNGKYAVLEKEELSLNNHTPIHCTRYKQDTNKHTHTNPINLHPTVVHVSNEKANAPINTIGIFAVPCDDNVGPKPQSI